MKKLVVLFFSICLFSCSGGFNETDLYGKWKTVDWVVAESGNSVNNKMDFSFDKDKNYEVDYGTEIERGKYWIFSDYLHTVAEGKTEIKVKILMLTADTLKFEMNRAGSLEKVVLVKE